MSQILNAENRGRAWLSTSRTSAGAAAGLMTLTLSGYWLPPCPCVLVGVASAIRPMTSERPVAVMSDCLKLDTGALLWQGASRRG